MGPKSGLGEVVVTPSFPCTALSTFSNFSLVLFGPNFRGKLFDHRLRIELRTRHRMRGGFLRQTSLPNAFLSFPGRPACRWQHTCRTKESEEDKERDFAYAMEGSGSGTLHSRR